MTKLLRHLARPFARHPCLSFAAAATATTALVLFLPAAALAAVPDVFTSQAFSTGATTATVQGFVNPEGQSTTYQFQWDLESSDWSSSVPGRPRTRPARRPSPSPTSASTEWKPISPD